MKSLKMILGCKIATVLVLSLFIFTSCSDNDDIKQPAYTGIWVKENSCESVSNESLQNHKYRSVVNFAKANFIASEQVLYETSSVWLDEYVSEGTVSVSGEAMTVRDLREGEPERDLDHYVIGAVELDEIPAVEQEDITIKWSVIGNKLTLNRDTDKNGVYEEDENMVFTRM